MLVARCGALRRLYATDAPTAVAHTPPARRWIFSFSKLSAAIGG